MTRALILVVLLVAGCSPGYADWRQKWSGERTTAESALATKGVWRAKAPFQIVLDGDGRYEICLLKLRLLRSPERVRCEQGMVEYRSNFRVLLLDFHNTTNGRHLFQNSKPIWGDDVVRNEDKEGEPMPEGAYDFGPWVGGGRCAKVPCVNTGTQETDRYIFYLLPTKDFEPLSPLEE